MAKGPTSVYVCLKLAAACCLLQDLRSANAALAMELTRMRQASTKVGPCFVACSRSTIHVGSRAATHTRLAAQGHLCVYLNI